MPAFTRTLSPLTVSTSVPTMAQAKISAISALTSGMAKGDEEAFRQFHAAYFDRLFRYQLVIARGDEHAAKEALQETLLRVVRHARRFDDEDAFWGWLTLLARSAATDVGRKRHRYWRMLASYANLIFRSGSNDSADSTDGVIEHLLKESLRDLEPQDRALVEGKYLRRAAVRELAVESGLTEKAVESRLLRARRELRKRILDKLRYET